MEKGLRIIPTFGCSAKCTFCYQAHLRDDKSTLSVEDMMKVLKGIDLKEYDYITFMGGEVTEIPDFEKHIAAVRNVFTGRINVTSNGQAPVEVYNTLSRAGANHFNFSVINPHLEEKIVEILADNQDLTVRVNVFLPDIDEDYPSIKDIKQLGKVRDCIDMARRNKIQINVLYDYRTEITDYDETVAKIERVAQGYVDIFLETKVKDVNFLIMRMLDSDSGFEVWFDINYCKSQELVVGPDGKQTRGFGYMEGRDEPV